MATAWSRTVGSLASGSGDVVNDCGTQELIEDCERHVITNKLSVDVVRENKTPVVAVAEFTCQVREALTTAAAAACVAPRRSKC